MVTTWPIFGKTGLTLAPSEFCVYLHVTSLVTRLGSLHGKLQIVRGFSILLGGFALLLLSIDVVYGLLVVNSVSVAKNIIRLLVYLSLEIFWFTVCWTVLHYCVQINYKKQAFN